VLLLLQAGALLQFVGTLLVDFIQAVPGGFQATLAASFTEAAGESPTLLSRETIPNQGYYDGSGYQGTFFGLSPAMAWAVRAALIYLYAAAWTYWAWIAYDWYREYYRAADWTPRDDVVDRLRSHVWGIFGFVVVFFNVDQFSLLMGVVVGFLALGAVQFLFAGAIADLLAPDLTATGRSLSVLYLRILAVTYWALGGTYTLLAGFNGASRTRTSFVADLIKYWAIRFPIAVAAVPATATFGAFGAFGVAVAPGLGWGVEAVFWAVAASNVVGFLGLGAYFWYTTRRGMFANAAERASGGDGAGADPADD
jgi:hypothetical protein